MKNKYHQIVWVVCTLFSINAMAENSLSSPQKIDIQQGVSNTIEPFVTEWLDYNNIELAQFTLKSSSTIDIESMSDPNSIYHRTFEISDDIYDPELNDYSPNKQYYVNLLETTGVYKDDDGQYYYEGGDDSQEIYLIDRNKKRISLLLWAGSTVFCERALWINNHTLLLLGINFDNDEGYFIILFDLEKSIKSHYTMQQKWVASDTSYFKDVNLKQRGIILPPFNE